MCYLHSYLIILSSTSDCPEGFEGENCSNKCRYPRYGRYCSKTCHCSEQKCHHVNGCSSAGKFG